MTHSIAPHDSPVLPATFPVGVVLLRSESSSPWQKYSWTVTSIVTGNGEREAGMSLIHSENETAQYLFSGLNVSLYIDECESYYHNLKSPNPGCFVATRNQDDDLDAAPEPFLVTLSFDEAHAYLEGDDQVFAVDIPAALYRWTEAYVIDHYVAEKRKKRKRKDWKHDTAGPQ